MLIITDTAAAVLRTIIRTAPADSRGGLRLQANEDTPGEPGVQMSLVARPQPGDLVAVSDPLVFLSACSVNTLRDQILDTELPDTAPPDDPTALRLLPRAA